MTRDVAPPATRSAAAAAAAGAAAMPCRVRPGLSTAPARAALGPARLARPARRNGETQGDRQTSAKRLHRHHHPRFSAQWVLRTHVVPMLRSIVISARIKLLSSFVELRVNPRWGPVANGFVIRSRSDGRSSTPQPLALSRHASEHVSRDEHRYRTGGGRAAVAEDFQATVAGRGEGLVGGAHHAAASDRTPEEHA